MVRVKGFVLSLVAFSLLASVSSARKIQVVPVTQHGSLTMNTDESAGYQVFPRRPCKIKVVGPGVLNIKVRLNDRRKRDVLSGRLEIRRGRKLIKKTRLKLHRSRVGRYLENRKLHPSLPKAFRIKVPKGLQTYTFSLKARRGTSMTLMIEYDTEADQSATGQVEMIALMPLVPPVGEAKNGSDLPPLVPPTTEEPKPTKAKVGKQETPSERPTLLAKKEKSKEATQKPPEPKPQVAVGPLPANLAKSGRPPEKLASPAAEKAKTASQLPPAQEKTAAGEKEIARKDGSGARQIEIRAPEPPRVEVSAPARGPSFAVGAKVGQISPLQKIGGMSITGSLDLRYLLPVLGRRLAVGLEVGAYHYGITIDSLQRQVKMTVIPLSVQAYYRLPLGDSIGPFIGAGFDLFVCLGQDRHTGSDYEFASTTGFAYGGHLSAGLEAHLGPGNLVAEVRAGASLGDPGVWSDNTNVYGLAAVLGYLFLF